MKRVAIFISLCILALSLCVRVLYPDLRELVYIPFKLLKLRYSYKVGKTRPVVWTRVPVSERRTEKPPNIVVILVDDLGLNDISFYGGGFYNISTPHINSIGHDGASFSKAYAGCATCAPSRASLLTGRYPTKVGFEFTPTGSTWGPYIFGNLIKVGDLPALYHKDAAASFQVNDTALPLSEITIAEGLKRAGYRSLHLGKWHLGNSLSPSAPFNRGFDDALTSFSGTYHLPENSPIGENCMLDDPMDKFVWAGMTYSTRFNNESLFEPDGHVTDFLAREATAAIHTNKDHPFFMYLSFTAMHTPLQALKTDYEKVSHIADHCSRVYAAMLLALDRGVGTVLQALEENGLTENTMVIFTSDNGAPGYIGLRDLNYPMRGHKGTFFEGGLRVPMLVKYPPVILPDTKVDSVVSHVDIFPTIMSLAGVDVKHEVDGMDILPLAEVAGRCAEAEVGDDSKACRLTSTHKTLFWRSSHYMALRKGNMKLKKSQRPQKIWLFDLESDPREQVNLASNVDYAEVLTIMMEELDEENSKQRSPLWPCLSESPVMVDKLASDPYMEGDEYVYWPN